MVKWICLVLGSVAGVFRATWSRWRSSSGWACTSLGTFIVNMSGCLLIGFLNSSGRKPAGGVNERLLLMTGFCGAYTTFSSFILETSSLFSCRPAGESVVLCGVQRPAGFSGVPRRDADREGDLAMRKTAGGDAPLIWMDLEMTGLDPERHVIIEIGCSVTTAS